EPIADEIEFDTFIKTDLRVAKIVEANLVEKAKKLIQLTLDVGDGDTRNVFAGIRKSFPDPSVLVGQQIVMVANLKPRKMKFGVSEGMVLATGPSDDQLVLVSAPAPAKPGDRVS
ncbi:MAG TPA: methionine--tRNA ligase subunit beta, partial [Myxococcales bacterium]|nr:methionine--tRNA ligase subunit beta [Myxococcales bacterium]